MDSVRARHEVLKGIRAFFYHRGFLEVETPYLTRWPAPDAHVEPLRVFVAGEGPFFLHTSPEIGMKKLLANGHEKIFQICKVFRVEELEEVHSTEFTMIEWYMPGNYSDAMACTEELVKSLARELKAGDQACFESPWKRYDLAGLCMEKSEINPVTLNQRTLFEAMRAKGLAGIQPDEPLG
jgi:elongation factor P--(R)-beta-lysine ligase